MTNCNHNYYLQSMVIDARGAVQALFSMDCKYCEQGFDGGGCTIFLENPMLRWSLTADTAAFRNTLKHIPSFDKYLFLLILILQSTLRVSPRAVISTVMSAFRIMLSMSSFIIALSWITKKTLFIYKFAIIPVNRSSVSAEGRSMRVMQPNASGWKVTFISTYYCSHRDLSSMG